MITDYAYQYLNVAFFYTLIVLIESKPDFLVEGVFTGDIKADGAIDVKYFGIYKLFSLELSKFLGEFYLNEYI